MPNIDISFERLGGIFRKIAELCDIGNEKGKLVSTGSVDEVSIFLKASKEYERGSFDIKGHKYFVDEGVIYDSLEAMKIAQQNPAPVDNTYVYVPAKELEAIEAVADVDNIDWLGIIEDNYNAESGKQLSQQAWTHRNTTIKEINRKGKPTFFLGQCKAYVRKVIEKMYEGCTLGGEFASDAIGQLRGEKNEKISEHFKEIPVGVIPLNQLPDGTILCYDKGQSGYSPSAGHIEIICHENGKTVGVSDGVTHNLRRPSAIFIPV